MTLDFSVLLVGQLFFLAYFTAWLFVNNAMLFSILQIGHLNGLHGNVLRQPQARTFKNSKTL